MSRPPQFLDSPLTDGGEAVSFTSLLDSDSSPDEVIGIFNCPNPSSRTMAVGSTLPLTEMSTRILLEGKGWPAGT
jgi:hypothetical protein